MTFPIKQLKAASDLVARGDFNTNVAASVAHRKDEIADLARTFDQMSSALGAAHALQNNLLRDISHELRSPLTRLVLGLELLMRSEGEERRVLEARINKDLGDLDKLIDEVMMLARFEAEHAALECSDVDLIAELTPLFDDAQFEANALNRSVEFHYPREPLRARIDVSQIRRAVENVVRNAIRHTPENSVVTVDVARNDDHIEITVQDEGDGVDEADLASIFVPFYRSKEANASSRGSGIGLALVERIVHAHGGWVSAHNTKDSGLAVHLTLPTRAESNSLP